MKKKLNYLFVFIFFLFQINNIYFSQDSWKKILKNKKGKVEINFYNSENFIIQKYNKLEGIEYDIFCAFFNYLEKKYHLKIKKEYKLATSFGSLLNKIEKGKNGQFGACSFSITPERLTKVNFTPKYMPDIEVLVCSRNLKIVDDTASFLKTFKNATALVVKNTTFEEDLNKIKKLLPNIKIEYTNTGIEILEKINQTDNYFGFSELPNYILSFKKGLKLKRQSLFRFERLGYGIIFPKNSDWKNVVDLIFNDEAFKKIIGGILRKHLGNDINDLLAEMSDEKKNKSEINLLNKELEIQRIEIQKNELESVNEKLIKNIFIGSILFISIIVLFLVYVNRKNKKTNKLLHIKNDEIEYQKNVIEKNNKNVISSINYAVRIQNSLLPTQEYAAKHLPNHYVIYLPKDIVCGDFYFIEPIKSNTGKFLKSFAVGDCTGHGVPGAFMSILAINYLNLSLSEKDVNSPADSLNFVSHKINKTLNSKNQLETIRDGLDISFCVFDEDCKKLYYSGANNPIYIIRKNEQNFELIEIKANKQALGYSDHFKPFTNNEIQLIEGDTIFLFTDGFADQFGGPTDLKNGKKYKYSRFKEFLIHLQEKEFDLQKELILQEFYTWKGNLEQVDDICILGIRI